MVIEKQKLIATFHHSFAGGSKSISRHMDLLSFNGYDVNAFNFQEPDYFLNRKSLVKNNLISADIISSEVIDHGLLYSYYLSNTIYEHIEAIKSSILFGANLFPYCDSLLLAKKKLQHTERNKFPLIVHPVGSDIWQIGVNLKSRVKYILNNKDVDLVVTYSNSFSEEIQDYFKISKKIVVMPPSIDLDKFSPITQEGKKSNRLHFGFDHDDFIIHHHSSLRKVKCPETIIEICKIASKSIFQKCALIISGPNPKVVAKNLSLQISQNPSTGLLKSVISDNLIIYWAGLVSDVERFIQIADVEINSSLHDSFNLSVMEAMACGIPVISSDVAGIAPIVLKSGGGYCFKSRRLDLKMLHDVVRKVDNKDKYFDIEEASNALYNLANNKEMALSMGKLGHNYIRNNFSPELTIANFNEIIKKISY